MTDYYRGQRIRDERTGRTYTYRGQIGSDTILLIDPNKPYAPPRRASRLRDSRNLRPL